MTTTNVQCKPILFSGEMVRAILEGRKTQTRRLIKPQPQYVCGAWTWDAEPGDTVIFDGWPTKLEESSGWYKRTAGELTPRPRKCPYGQPDDLLWVREALGQFSDRVVDPAAAEARYVADSSFAFVGWPWQRSYLPSIFMPRWASRIKLRVESVRVERVQEIAAKDAIADGIHQMDNGWWAGTAHRVKNTPRCMVSAIEAFHDHWDALNAARGYGWDKNPWVWVIEFSIEEMRT